MLLEFEQDLLVLRNLNMKVNCSALSRKYGISRQTISRYVKGFKKKQSREKPSKLDKYKDEIMEKMSFSGVTITGVYEYFRNKYSDADFGSRSNFDFYVRKHNLIHSKTQKVHPRYETPYGKQLQFDYKEKIKMTSKSGEIFHFNIFTTSLGASRACKFTYSKTKSKEDTIRCLIESFIYYGGVPKEVLTDNMSGIVNTKTKEFSSEFLQFSKDFQIIPKKCKIRTPETKGKVESLNRFINRLFPYNNEFETEEELIDLVNNLTEQVNNLKNQTTNMKPSVLLEKEKEYLSPLPTDEIINSYLSQMQPVKVDNNALIYYKSKRYSVPLKFINKTLKLREVNGNLYLYHNLELVRIHCIDDKVLNYNQKDYHEVLQKSMPYKSRQEIDEITRMNLKHLDNLEG